MSSRRRRRIPTEEDKVEMDLYEKKFRIQELILAILKSNSGYIDPDSLINLAMAIDEKIQGIKI